jgi:hypothetical protein
LQEVVLPLGLCPWAESALGEGKVATEVLSTPFRVPDDLTRIVDLVRRTLLDAAEHIDLILIVLPRLSTTRLQMDDILRAVRADGDRTFALAAFHPEAPRDLETPERLIPFLRRSPDPLLQAVRQSRLERLAPRKPSGTAFLDIHRLSEQWGKETPAQSLREQIARQNFCAVQKFGVDRLEAVIEDILEDHARSRAGILAPDSRPHNPW